MARLSKTPKSFVSVFYVILFVGYVNSAQSLHLSKDGKNIDEYTKLQRVRRQIFPTRPTRPTMTPRPTMTTTIRPTTTTTQRTTTTTTVVPTTTTTIPPTTTTTRRTTTTTIPPTTTTTRRSITTTTVIPTTTTTVIPKFPIKHLFLKHGENGFVHKLQNKHQHKPIATAIHNKPIITKWTADDGINHHKPIFTKWTTNSPGTLTVAPGLTTTTIKPQIIDKIINKRHKHIQNQSDTKKHTEVLNDDEAEESGANQEADAILK